MLSWDQNAYKSWRSSVFASSTAGPSGGPTAIVGYSPIPKSKAPLKEKKAKSIKVSENMPDEWLETWVENITGNLQGNVRTLAWSMEKRKSGEGAAIQGNQQPDSFLESFKAVGFTSGASEETGKQFRNRSSVSTGNLVTMKASSSHTNCHMIFFPCQFTGRLIGKNGKNVQELKENTKARNINITSGVMEVFGPYSTAQSALLAVRKSLIHFATTSPTTTTTASRGPTCFVPPKSLDSITKNMTKNKSLEKNVYSNMFKCLDMRDTVSDGPTNEATQHDQQDKFQDETATDETATYDAKVQAGCAWVSHRNATILMLHDSIIKDEERESDAVVASEPTSLQSSPKRPPIKDKPLKSSHLASLNQDTMIIILSYFDSSEAISSAASLANVNKKIALIFLTCYHRVWKSLASRAWPHLGVLRTKQPLLYPLACAMHQHRVAKNNNHCLNNGGGGGGQQLSHKFHSISYNSVSIRSASQVYALELEYTINPKTAACDAMKVKGLVTFSSFESLKQCASSSDDGGHANPTILVPFFRGARQWLRLKEFAIEQLNSIGSLGRKTYQRSNQRKDARFLSPLKPLLVTMKTYMVNACDGAGIDMDSFVCVWRLLLALTDPHDKEGAMRRSLIESDLKQFSLGKYEPSDLGNFIPSILIISPSEWKPVLRMYLNKAMSKNVMWCYRDLCLKNKKHYIDFYKSDSSLSVECSSKHGLTADSKSKLNDFLQMCFDSGAVSRKTVLFWVALEKAFATSNFLGLSTSLMERDRAELVHGFIATPSLKDSFNGLLDGMKQIDSWVKLFRALRETSKSPATASAVSPSSIDISQQELLSILQASYIEGLEKKYFHEKTDFAAIHANGGSNLFLIGNRFSKAAFMIDHSGSMGMYIKNSGRYQPNATNKNRYQAVCTNLMQLLESKPVDFAFSVQLFNQRITSFKEGHLQQNTPFTRSLLKTFLQLHGPQGGTNLVGALDALLKVKEAQEVFLLTDGEGSGESNMVQMALDSSIPIHCIGVALSRSGCLLLQRVAKAGQGECSFVDEKELSAGVTKAA